MRKPIGASDSHRPDNSLIHGLDKHIDAEKSQFHSEEAGFLNSGWNSNGLKLDVDPAILEKLVDRLLASFPMTIIIDDDEFRRVQRDRTGAQHTLVDYTSLHPGAEAQWSNKTFVPRQRILKPSF